MAETIILGVELETVHCGTCGGVYALGKRYIEKKYEEGGYWTCPYCGSSWGYGQSEMSRLKKRLENSESGLKSERNKLAAEKARHDQTKMSLRGQKAAKSRIKNRIAKGVCPCCNRYFENLHSHIEKKHPNYNSPAAVTN